MAIPSAADSRLSGGSIPPASFEAANPANASSAALQGVAKSGLASTKVSAHFGAKWRPRVSDRSRQSGGTTLGILVGIVLGLAIAVVTALLVTKTSLPFIGPSAKSGDKATVSTAAAPPTGTVPEAPKPQVPVAPGDLPDPNRTAAARQRVTPGQAPAERREIATVNATVPAVPAPPGASPQAPLSPPAVVGGGTVRPVVIPGSAPGAGIAGSAGSAGEGQAPIRAAVPSNPGAASSTLPSVGAVPAPQAAVVSTDRGATYLLQAGAFRGPEDADAMKLRLALMGLEAQIVTAEVSGTTLYRVRVGPYAGLDAMTRARTRLAENGVEATVLRQR